MLTISNDYVLVKHFFAMPNSTNDYYLDRYLTLARFAGEITGNYDYIAIKKGQNIYIYKSKKQINKL